MVPALIRKLTLAALLLTCTSGIMARTARNDNAGDVWHGAGWIGGDNGSISFYSRYVPVFKITFNLRLLDKDSKAGIIYGANDLRLLDSGKNIYHIQNSPDSSYIELQFSADSLRVFRRGYSPDDRNGTALRSFAIPDGIDFTRSHRITVNSNTGLTTIHVDSVQVAGLNVSTTPGGGDHIAYPVIGDVGYNILNGKASIDNFEVRNFRSPHNILAQYDFGEVCGFRIVSLPETGTTSLRCKFKIGNKRIAKATLRATARGIYDAYLNGQLIDSCSYLNPGASQYNKSHYYQTYDLTSLLRRGSNMLGFTLAEGWWSGAVSFDTANWNWFGDRQSLLCCLEIEYSDGTSDIIVSQPDRWEYSTDGPLRYGSLFQGEVYDATRRLFKSGKWRKALTVPLAGVVSDRPNGGWPLADDYGDFSLIKDNNAGVKAFDEIAAISSDKLPEGQFLYDMGVNHAGVPAITFRGLKRGQKIVIRYAEVLYPANRQYAAHIGRPMVENLRAAMCQDIYIASGADVETYNPRSTYHGYRYIEITGIDNPLPLDDVKSIVLSSVENFTSGFECSDSLVNKLVDNIRRSTLSNVFSIPTDCPQRNERMGWSGDVSVFAPSMSYLFDARDFLSRHIRALNDTRESNGAYAPIAPMGGGFGGPLWQSAGIILPWQLYIQYADTSALATNYQAMSKYIDMVLENYIDTRDGHFKGTESWIDLGDWLGPQCNQNEKPLLFDSYLVHELGIMENAAKILGKEDDADRYAEARDRRIRYINTTYADSKNKVLTGRGFGPQRMEWTGPLGGLPDGKVIEAHSSYAVPLALNTFDSVNRPLMAERLSSLVRNVTTGDDGRLYPPHSLMTGFVGTPWILYALTDNGYAADAYSILLNRDYPSWLYPVELGATTVWERLNSMTRKDGFGRNNGMNSFNHYAFGCVYDWLMQRCAGINPDINAPGFKHIILTPHPDSTGRMTSAKGWYDSINGRIESGWSINSRTTIFTATIPDGTTASLHLPDGIHELGPGSHRFEFDNKTLSDNGISTTRERDSNASFDCDRLRSELNEFVRDKDATIGVAVIIDGKDTVTVNGNRQFPMLSVYKFPIALALADFYRANGLDLDSPVAITAGDLHPDTHSPMRTDLLSDAATPADTLTVTTRDLLAYMLRQSDNNASDIAMKIVGGPENVTRYLRRLGIEGINVANSENEMHSDNSLCYLNSSSPLAAAMLIGKFEREFNDTISAGIKQMMQSCDTGTGRLPKPFINTDATIGHKTGTGFTLPDGRIMAVNDIGYILLPGNRKLSVAVFIENSGYDMTGTEGLIAAISDIVRNNLTDY